MYSTLAHRITFIVLSIVVAVLISVVVYVCLFVAAGHLFSDQWRFSSLALSLPGAGGHSGAGADRERAQDTSQGLHQGEEGGVVGAEGELGKRYGPVVHTAKCHSSG